MNGNSIYDFYVDDERIWIANYPIGITVRNNQYASYEWIKHSIGNKQSLVNDQVNAIIEDHEGDLWFATNNGISLYSTKTKQWHSFLSVFDNGNVTKNHVSFLCARYHPASSGQVDTLRASTKSIKTDESGVLYSFYIWRL